MSKTKKMPHVLHLSLFLFILGLICASLLASINYLTAPVIEENKIKEVQAALKEVGLNEAVDVTKDITLVPGVESVYEGKNNKGQRCFAFNTAVKNQFTVVTTMIVINGITKSLENVKVLDTTTITTLGPAKDKLFLESDFGVVDKNESNYKDSFTPVSGATISSSSVKKAIKASYEQLKSFDLSVKETPLTDLTDVTILDTELLENAEKLEKVTSVETAKYNDLTVYIISTEVKEQYKIIKTKFVIDQNGVLINITPEGKINGIGDEENDKSLNHNYGVIGSTESTYESSFEIISGSTGTSNSIKSLLALAYKQFNKTINSFEVPLESLTDVKALEVELVADEATKRSVLSVEEAKLDGKKVYIIYSQVEEQYKTIKCKIVLDEEGKILNITPEGEINGIGDEENEKSLNHNYGIIGSNKDTYESNFDIITGSTGTSNSLKDLITISYQQFAKIGGSTNEK